MSETYCQKCGGCGFVGCDGIKGFLKEHIAGKTDCTNESSFLHEIIEAFEEVDDLSGVIVLAKSDIKSKLRHLVKSYGEYRILQDLNKFTDGQMQTEFPEYVSLDKVEKTLSTMVGEIIGNHTPALSGEGGQAVVNAIIMSANNRMKAEQHQNAVDRGFTL